MWKSNKNGAEPPAEVEALGEIRSTTRGAFRLVYGFILQAVKGDKPTANLIFEDYLAGKLSEELLSISRRWVSADQAGSSKGEIERNGAVQRQLREHAAGGVGGGDEPFTAVA